jgi:hypothetical protein
MDLEIPRWQPLSNSPILSVGDVGLTKSENREGVENNHD